MPSVARKVAAFAVTVVALFVLFLVAVNTGSLQVTPLELFNGLFVEYDETVATIYDLRFPRIFIAMLGGAAIAVSGALLQAAIRNPLADPGIIGINAGASLGAVLVTMFLPTLYFSSPLFAFAGGMVAFALVYSLSWRGGLSPLRIILVGVAVASLFNGILAALESTSGSSSSVTNIIDANITLKTWDDLQTLAIYAVPALVVSMFLCKRCDLLALEDKTARSLGLDVNKNRIGISAVAVMLASIGTAIIGSISFLGLIVPHLARLLVGSQHKVLIPYCMVLGAFCLLLADTIGRTIIYPYEISAAVVMAIVGGPVFIVLLRRSQSNYGE